MKLLGQLLCLLSITHCPLAWAMDSTDILPASINSPAFKYGMVSGVDSKYAADGSVKTLNDINTVHFNSEQISKLDGRVVDLVNALNSFSHSHLGNQLDLGTLRIETEPKVTYLAPVYARGITDRFTMAVGLPVVFYKNKLSFNQSASNVRQICSQFQGAPEIKEACDQLDFAVTDAASNKIVAQGYKPVKDRNETVFGDAQLVGLYKLYDDQKYSLLARGTLNLPTGPKNDPDDLADLGIFGNTSFEPQLLANWQVLRSLRLAAKASYKIVVPDSLEVRVPGNADDVLPGPETKEKVSRNTGDTITLGTSATLAVYKSLSIAGGYEYLRKAADSYRGNRGLRYDLLSKDTNSTAHRLRAGVAYDTIAIYQRTKTFPPLKFDFEVSNTVAGTNIDRQLVNEFTFTMFF